VKFAVRLQIVSDQPSTYAKAVQRFTEGRLFLMISGLKFGKVFIFLNLNVG
jgi:hypothetical protein